MEKMEVPQVVEATGLAGDFLNETATLAMAVGLYEDKKYSAEKVIDLINEKIAGSKNGILVKTYEARYPAAKFKDVVTDHNRANVEKLNELATLINAEYRALLADSLLDAEDKIKAIMERIVPLCTEIRELIEGKNKP